MQIKLDDGIMLEPYKVVGTQKHLQGALRDTLTFIFPATESMEYLDSVFTEANCEKITLVGVNNGTDAIYNDYTIRCELKKEYVETAQGTATESPVYEERIFVSMSQRTYTEKQLASVCESVDLLVLDSLTGV